MWLKLLRLVVGSVVTSWRPIFAAVRDVDLLLRGHALSRARLLVKTACASLDE